MLHDISSLQNVGFPPLHMAAAGGHDAVIAVLLDNGANVNQVAVDGWSPIHFAVHNGHDAAVAVLLDKGANINHLNNDGYSPVYRAAKNGHETVVVVLIDRGADVNLADNDGDRPIDVAKTQKIKDMLIALTKEKPQEEGQQPPGQAVPTIMDESQWFRAAKKGDLALIQQGINDNKIDVNCRDSKGCTAVYWAAQQGYLQLVEYLITQHADLSITTVSANDVL